MIDYILAFPDEATAIADPVVGAYYVPASAMSPVGQWRGDCCFPGIAVYRQTGTQTITLADGTTETVPVNTPVDAYWRLAIALRHRDPALDAHPATTLITDRDIGQTGAGRAAYVLWSLLPLSALDGMIVSPLPAGAEYLAT